VDAVILGGDLNFSLGAIEVWGPREISDSLSEYFSHKLGEWGLIDVDLVKLKPTWRKN
jgi:hypothetical protein